jgi:hypothetical protein
MRPEFGAGMGVDIVVWDVLCDLERRGDATSTLYDKTANRLMGIALRRGGELLFSPAITVFSLRQDAGSEWSFTLRQQALLEFVVPLARYEMTGVRDVNDQLMSVAMGRYETGRLTVGNQDIPCASYPIGKDGWALASVDPTFPVAIAGSAIDIPVVTPADPATWRDDVQRVLTGTA